MGRQRLADALRMTADWVPGMLLDVGCGRGEFLLEMTKRGHLCSGTEIVPELCIPGFITEAWPDNLPFRDAEFQYVTCLDVIEHLPRGWERPVIRELARVCGGGLAIAINLHESTFLGKDLHPNLRSLEEWTAILDAETGMTLRSLDTSAFSPVWVFDRLF